MKIVCILFLFSFFPLSCLKKHEIVFVHGNVLDKYSRKPFGKNIFVYVTKGIAPSNNHVVETYTNSDGNFYMIFNKSGFFPSYVLRVSNLNYLLYFQKSELFKGISSDNFSHTFYGICRVEQHMVFIKDSITTYDSVLVNVQTPEYTSDTKLSFDNNYSYYYFNALATNPHYLTIHKWLNGNSTAISDTIIPYCTNDPLQVDTINIH
ncbi:MAG: hypothetical protein HY840_05400 [Bacteroidetes bacterium]|nr:hypothetical protein [Bacteroidota bacterium]